MTNPETEKPEYNLATIVAEYNDEDKSRELLESLRWPNGVICPHCGESKPYKIVGRADSKMKARAGLYKCCKCRKQFTFKVGTIFEDCKIPCSKWCMAIALICSSKKALSSHQLHRMLVITQKTAWFMNHRIRHAFKPLIQFGKLGGEVEIDEGFFGIKNQAKKQVVALIERGGEVRTKVIDRLSHRNIGQFMRENIARGSTLNTDGNPRYKGLYLPAVKHNAVNHSQKEFIRERADGSKVHVNHYESYFSLLKRGITGAFHHISTDHLPRYCDEFSFGWNLRNFEVVRFTLRGPKGICLLRRKRRFLAAQILRHKILRKVHDRWKTK